MVAIFVKDCNTISQEIYDRTINNINFSSLKCTCGHTGCLTRHAYYTRTVRFKSAAVVLTILRVKCKQCGKTHAVLLSSIVPYSQIPLEDQINIIQCYEKGEKYSHVLDENFLIDPREIYLIIQKYLKHWKQRLMSEGISICREISIQCFLFFRRQFMQIRCAPYQLLY